MSVSEPTAKEKREARQRTTRTIGEDSYIAVLSDAGMTIDDVKHLRGVSLIYKGKVIPMSELSAKEKHEAQQLATRKAVSAAASKVEDGVITVGEDPYVAVLGDAGWTKDDVKRLRRVTTDYIGAAHQAVGEIAVNAMAKDKELSKVIANIDLSTFGDVTSVINRVHIGNNPKTQEQVITYGTSVAKVSILSGSNKSALNVACEAVKALAADKLK